MAAQVQALRNVWRAHRPLYLAMLAALGITAGQVAWLGLGFSDFHHYRFFLGAIFVHFAATMALLAGIAFFTGGMRWSRLRERARAYVESETFLFGLAGTIILSTGAALFIVQKCFIPHLHPFGYWDPIFAAADKWVHFGAYPHEYVVPLVERFPWTARVIDISYFGWYVILTATGIYCLYLERNFARRMQFIWGYLLTFLLCGCVAAMAFSSVGPVFYGDFIGGANPYLPLMEHLERLNASMRLNFFAERHWLVDWTRNEAVIDPNSISAMPSMHNATMLFSALYWRSIHRGMFLFVAAMAALVFVGSIYTGFHYAIDAYVAYGMVAALWYMSGRLVKKLYPDLQGLALSR